MPSFYLFWSSDTKEDPNILQSFSEWGMKFKGRQIQSILELGMKSYNVLYTLFNLTLSRGIRRLLFYSG